jgi:hypothetical protein
LILDEVQSGFDEAEVFCTSISWHKAWYNLYGKRNG